MSLTPEASIIIGSGSGRSVSVGVSSRARELCACLRSIPPGSSLPGVSLEPFRLVLAYLDGDESLSTIHRRRHESHFLLLFAQTWSLAARLGLPALQNRLISILANIYNTYIDHGYRGFGHRNPTNDSLFQIFQHLRDQVGCDSHAEQFLVCFIGRATPLVCNLERQLDRQNFDKDIKQKILAQARSFERDPIEHDIYRFYVSTLKPPTYPPLEVEPAPDYLVYPLRSLAREPNIVRRNGQFEQAQYANQQSVPGLDPDLGTDLEGSRIVSITIESDDELVPRPLYCASSNPRAQQHCSSVTENRFGVQQSGGLDQGQNLGTGIATFSPAARSPAFIPTQSQSDDPRCSRISERGAILHHDSSNGVNIRNASYQPRTRQLEAARRQNAQTQTRTQTQTQTQTQKDRTQRRPKHIPNCCLVPRITPMPQKKSKAPQHQHTSVGNREMPMPFTRTRRTNLPFHDQPLSHR